MNRRNFLGSLATIPFVGSVMKALAITPKPLVTELKYDQYDVLTPEEMSQHWFYVKSPTLNGHYACRTWALKSYIETDDHTKPPIPSLKIKKDALNDIIRLGLTHVRCVKYGPVIITPDWKSRWRVCVSGFTLKDDGNVCYYPQAAFKRGFGKDMSSEGLGKI